MVRFSFNEEDEELYSDCTSTPALSSTFPCFGSGFSFSSSSTSVAFPSPTSTTSSIFSSPLAPFSSAMNSTTSTPLFPTSTPGFPSAMNSTTSSPLFPTLTPGFPSAMNSTISTPLFASATTSFPPVVVFPSSTISMKSSSATVNSFRNESATTVKASELLHKEVFDEINEAEEHPHIVQSTYTNIPESVKEGLQSKAGESNGTQMVAELVKNVSEIENSNNVLKSPVEESLNEAGTSEAKDESSKYVRFAYARTLRGITLNPHFTPLQSYSKRAREKLIVAWDEIFEETIDHIQSLTAETFSRHVNDLWKTVAELENLGYSVARLKNRLDVLTDVMNKRNASQVEISELKVKAEDYRKAKVKIEKEMADLQVQAETAQVMVDELMDQVDKMDRNLPILDALFENSAKNPL